MADTDGELNMKFATFLPTIIDGHTYAARRRLPHALSPIRILI